MTQDGGGRKPELSARRVLSLAAPALVVLAAEPLYLLLDTAVVGHLGTTQLAALAVGGVILAQVAGQFNFLAYGTTARAARRFGAGDRAAAVREGLNASALAIVVGGLAIALVQAVAGPIVRLIAGGADPSVTAAAELWLRIAILGAPGILLALAGNGWMRGVQDTRRPTVYILVANAISVGLLPLLVYGVGLGLIGSAVANVVAQTIGGGLFVRALLREVDAVSASGRRRPDRAVMGAQLRTGRDLMIRTLALQGSFIAAAAFAARMGPSVVGAHQIGLQLFMFLALVLDSLAIAAQTLVGAALGAADPGRARRAARLVARLGLVAGVVAAALLLAGRTAVPSLFTSSTAVLDQVEPMWWWLIAMQPIAGVLFALDGVLMGSGDTAVLRTITIVSSLLVYLPIATAAFVLGWGLSGIWGGLTASLVVRLAFGWWRVRGERWQRVGQP